MNKPKYFLYIFITTTILLLIFGNWVTSAQATGVEVTDVTLYARQGSPTPPRLDRRSQTLN